MTNDLAQFTKKIQALEDAERWKAAAKVMAESFDKRIANVRTSLKAIAMECATQATRAGSNFESKKWKRVERMALKAAQK